MRATTHSRYATWKPNGHNLWKRRGALMYKYTVIKEREREGERESKKEKKGDYCPLPN